MKLNSLHFLLTYKCTVRCDHCFVFGDPGNKGSISKEHLAEWIDQASTTGSIKWIFFEGGEPFLFPEVLALGLRRAKKHRFKTGIVSNGFWARTAGSGLETLKPLADKIDYLQISSDRLHGEEKAARHAIAAAESLGISNGVISIEVPHEGCGASSGDVLFKGRAAENLTKGLKSLPWESFTSCSEEEFVSPGRLHIDQFGNAHLCQGIVVGNLMNETLSNILQNYDSGRHPVIGPLKDGGPAALVRKFNLPHENKYVDQCHLCYSARKELAGRFPCHLAPEYLYAAN